MAKRVVAIAIGGLSVLAGLVAFAFAIEMLQDFIDPVLRSRLEFVAELVLFSMAFSALAMGFGLLRFGFTGRNSRSTSWVRPIILGILFFFPGFVFSMPLTMIWANHKWPGEGLTGLAAMEVSFYIGIAAAIICTIVLLKKRRSRDTRTTP
jgi:uncharacterized membrane protein YidH (DUF202 family)